MGKCRVSVKNGNMLANCIDLLTEVADYEQSHLNLHCLQRYLFCSAGLTSLQPKYHSVLDLITTLYSEVFRVSSKMEQSNFVTSMARSSV